MPLALSRLVVGIDTVEPVSSEINNFRFDGNGGPLSGGEEWECSGGAVSGFIVWQLSQCL